MGTSYEHFRTKYFEVRKPAERLFDLSTSAGAFWVHTGCTDPISCDQFIEKLKVWTFKGLDHNTNTLDGFPLDLLEEVISSMAKNQKNITIDSLILFLSKEGKGPDYKLGEAIRAALTKKETEKKEKEGKEEKKTRTSNADIDFTPILGKLEETTCLDARNNILLYFSGRQDFKYPRRLIRYYVEKQMSENERVTKRMITIWLAKARDNTTNPNICEILKASLDKLLSTETDCKQTAGKLYEAGKKFYNEASRAEGLAFTRSLFKGFQYFKLYRWFIENGHPVQREPINDRHLWYLCQLDVLQNPYGSSGDWGKEWEKWSQANGTTIPEKQKESA